MKSFLEDLELGTKVGPFEPASRYFAGMDMFIYLSEDVSYRAERVDGYLTALRHPHDDRIVGLKLKGFRWLFNEVQGQLGLADDDFVYLVEVLQIILVRVGDELIRDVERRQKYREIRLLAAELRLRVGDVLKVA